jgi:anti-anti-sigma factor
MSNATEQSSDESLDFDVYVDHVARCVEVVGDLDLATVPLLVDAAVSLRTNPPRDITIDLESVTFIDAGAFGALVGLSNVQYAQGALLHLVGNAHVRRIAGLCGLDSLL